MNDLISVIVPVYKVEKYLEKCIKSILNQTYQKFELILIDDGSPDNCGKICDEYAYLDQRIKVIHKQNEGLSAARNSGMEIAQGLYYIFVDSDDYVEVTFLETLYNLIIKYDADIAITNFVCTTNKNYSSYQGEIISGSSQEVLLYLMREVSWSAWGKLFKKSLIENYQFKKGILYEDFEFIPRIFLGANKAVYINLPLYNYLIREDSIMTLSKLKEVYIDIANENLKLFDNYNLSKNMKENLKATIYMHFIWDINKQFECDGRIANKIFEIKMKKFIQNNINKILKNSQLNIVYKFLFLWAKLSLKTYGKMCYFKNQHKQY